MSEFKGTKGKWFARKQMDGCYLISGFHWSDFCEVVTITDGGDLDGEFQKTASANALLISKAPEMLEMLEKISEFITNNEKINYKVRLLSKEVPFIKQLIKESTEL